MKKYFTTSVNMENMKITVFPSSFSMSEKIVYTRPHSHANFEFHILFRGNAMVDIEDKKYTFRQNDYIFLFPDTFHQINNQSEDALMLSLSFSITKIEKNTSTDYYSALIEYITSENDHAIIQQNPMITEYIRKINTLLYLESVFANEQIKALLTLLFSEMLMPIFSKSSLNQGLTPDVSELDSRVYMIENYFNDHYMENITLAKLSAILYLSEKQTNRMIQKAYGSDFRECLSKMRLKNAKKLLRETDIEVKSIADAVGYQSYNGFYLAFKNKFGITPLEYRNQYTKEKEAVSK